MHPGDDVCLFREVEVDARLHRVVLVDGWFGCFQAAAYANGPESDRSLPSVRLLCVGSHLSASHQRDPRQNLIQESAVVLGLDRLRKLDTLHARAGEPSGPVPVSELA